MYPYQSRTQGFPHGVLCGRLRLLRAHPCRQGLTLVHFSAQLELCLTRQNTPTLPPFRRRASLPGEKRDRKTPTLYRPPPPRNTP